MTPSRNTPWWLWPHVLSLEAPLVAVLWQRALAQAHGVRLTPMLEAGLALACWLIYAADRLLDGVSAKSAELGPRHAFYRRHRRLLLLGIIPPALLALAWMALRGIPEGMLWQAAGLALLVALYLASWAAREARAWHDLLISCAGLGGVVLIARLPASAGFRLTLSLLVLGVMVLSFMRQLDFRLGHLLPKEISAALLFALGVTTGTRFLGMPETLLAPVLECGLLALLFACNLHGISARRRRQDGGRHLLLVNLSAACMLITLWLARAGALDHALLPVARAALGALVLHWLVQLRRDRLSEDAHRVLSDLALILPLPLAWL